MIERLLEKYELIEILKLIGRTREQAVELIANENGARDSDAYRGVTHGDHEQIEHVVDVLKVRASVQTNLLKKLKYNKYESSND